MKTVWNIVSFLAVVHLMALVLFSAWLWQSGRLDRTRIESVREMFSLTIEEAEQRAREAEQEAERLKLEAEHEASRKYPPLSSSALLAQVSQVQEVERLALRRLQNERAALAGQMESVMARLAAREAQLESNRTQWVEAIEAERARRADEQFAKTVLQYQSLPAKQGKSMLLELIQADQMDQAVAYLDAMNVRAASKILSEFKTEAEIQLATELLERLRTFGLPTEDSQDSANADARHTARNPARPAAPGSRADAG